jgi:hypothetical protein
VRCLVLALQSSQLPPYVAVLAVGFLVGVFGHIIRSRPLIIIGIVMIGLVSVYFGFFVAKVR